MTVKHLNRVELGRPLGTLPANLEPLARHRLRDLLPQTSDLVAHHKTREVIRSSSIKQSSDRINCQVQLQWPVRHGSKVTPLIELSNSVI